METQNRYRKKLTVTIDPDTLSVINAMSMSKGQFIDECVRAYMTGEHFYWITQEYGVIHIVGDKGEYCVKKLDDDVISPRFGSMLQCLHWIKDSCPRVRL